MRRGAGLVAALALVACQAAPAAPGPGDAFDPIAFFDGPTHGRGRIMVMMGRPRPLSVESVGRRDGDALVLDQAIAEGDKRRTRRWVMRPDGPGRWRGTLTDAVGPVAIEAADGALRIQYRMKRGLAVDQRLALVAPGRIANRMTVRKWGMVVARIEETIVRGASLGDAPRPR